MPPGFWRSSFKRKDSSPAPNPSPVLIKRENGSLRRGTERDNEIRRDHVLRRSTGSLATGTSVTNEMRFIRIICCQVCSLTGRPLASILL